MILYHGSPNRHIVPTYGLGEDRHDYGRGFYLTESLELAREWAVCTPDENNGFVHKFDLDIEHLRYIEGGSEIVNYREYNARYNKRDARARVRMRELIDSDANKLNRVFSTIIQEG